MTGRKIFKFWAILTLLAFSTSCTLLGVSQISTKKIKNKITGKTEEYRSVRIAQDDQNDYFLDMRIPENYKEVNSQYGDFLMVYRFSEGEANPYRYRGVLLSRTHYDPQLSQKALEDHRDWYNSKKEELYGAPLFKNISSSIEKISPDLNLKSYTTTYINSCVPDRKGSICFGGQKIITITKVFLGMNRIWAIEYAEKISPLGDDNYAKTVENRLEMGKDIVSNCCKINAVEKKSKNL